MSSMSKQRYIALFSCGAASTVATKLALDEFGSDAVRIVYMQTNSEHSDNVRYITDCEAWFGKEVEQLSSPHYEDIWDVFKKTRYLAGVGGARCTGELKRKVSEALLDWGPDQQIEVFGYTVEEQARVERFVEHNTERKIDPILIRKGLTKADCYRIVQEAGIELPMMYKLGYNNNNCIGCVKGQGGYWNKIRKDFPDVFDRMAKMEREIGAAINKSYAGDGKRKRMFLDELPEDFGRGVTPPPIDCGVICEVS